MCVCVCARVSERAHTHHTHTHHTHTHTHTHHTHTHSEGHDFDGTKRRVAEESAPLMMAEFAAAIGQLSSASGAALPKTTYVVGHRWSAAFPSQAATVAPSNTPYYLDADLRIVCCGDYFPSYPGRVEGAWTCGDQAGKALLSVVA